MASPWAVTEILSSGLIPPTILKNSGFLFNTHLHLAQLYLKRNHFKDTKGEKKKRELKKLYLEKSFPLSPVLRFCTWKHNPISLSPSQVRWLFCNLAHRQSGIRQGWSICWVKMFNFFFLPHIMILFSLQPLEFCLCCLSPKLIHEFSSLPRWRQRHREGWARGIHSFLRRESILKDFFSSCDKLNALKETTAAATGLRGGTLFSLQALDFCEGALCSCANSGLYFIILRTKGCSN